MICWRCSHPVPADQVACPHCSPGSSQNVSAHPDKAEVQVREHVAEAQSPALWESSAPSTYRVTATVPRDTGLVWGGFTSIFFGVVSCFTGPGGIAFGVIVIICGVLTLAVSRFGARPRNMIPWPERILVYPGWLIAGVFLLTTMIITSIISLLNQSS